jgi:membrane-associated phospholipid phosphatase
MRRDPRLALLGAAACLAGLVATGLAALVWPPGRSRDVDALAGIVALNRGRAAALADGIVHLADPKPYAIFGVGLIAIALIRGRRRLALALPVVLVGAALTAEILKPLLATPRADSWIDAKISVASWPSGHATAALTLALCAVLVAPRRLRPAAAVLGALLAAAVAYAILILAWHFPSDVLGGFFVAAIWVLLAVAALLAAERRRPEARPPAHSGPAVLWPIELAVGAALAVASAIALARPDQVGEFAAENTTAVAMLGVIVALALALAGGVARTLRR